MSESVRSYAPRAAQSAIDKAALAGRGGQDLLCFSHLRWDFVFQRPQHLMTRFAQSRRVIYWEEPVGGAEAPALDVRSCPKTGVIVATPHLPETLHGADRDAAVTGLLDGFLASEAISLPIRWYYTPMMLGISRHIEAAAIVYDCMDELSNFKFAPPELKSLEQELLGVADVVFTGGYSLYEAKRHAHDNIHPFPSSVDRAHFGLARTMGLADAPDDQSGLPSPRLGFYGVVDERMDLDLLAHIADARPDWSLVIVGPVVKIDPANLPNRPNIRYVGGKSYADLPRYLAGWDVALMPFAINESTRFISPTKTPEYLAGGRPVVSTPITDVIRHYGDLEAVRIAATPDAFVAECDAALALAAGDGAWLDAADKVLAEMSWEETFTRMSALIDAAIAGNRPALARPAAANTDAPSPRGGGRLEAFDYLIVGAGFAGAVLAERLAAGSNKRVLVIDKRPHIAGNAYDHKDAAGVLIHKYGPHIFHTNSQEIFSYLSRFTKWRPYEHRVLSDIAGVLMPMPINRTTLNTLYGLSLSSDEEAEAFLKSRAEPVEHIATSEDVVINQVGRDLYEKFFRGYTRKQWGLDPSELDKMVTARVPTRTNTDDRYFLDTFQAMPLEGYTRMFENMLDHKNIHLMLGVEFEDIRNEVVYDKLIYTGPVDEFFDYRYGKLPYRCLEFKHETLDQPWLQPVACVNYPTEEVPYTRITEYKHLTGQKHEKTSVTYEYPCAEGDPYYPIPRPENQTLYKRYEALALQTPDVQFVGRLATYKYYNMDQVVGQALATYRRMGEQAKRATLDVAETKARVVAGA